VPDARSPGARLTWWRDRRRLSGAHDRVRPAAQDGRNLRACAQQGEEVAELTERWGDGQAAEEGSHGGAPRWRKRFGGWR
jgi:hypothetical protein